MGKPAVTAEVVVDSPATTERPLVSGCAVCPAPQLQNVDAAGQPAHVERLLVPARLSLRPNGVHLSPQHVGEAHRQIRRLRSIGDRKPHGRPLLD